MGDLEKAQRLLSSLMDDGESRSRSEETGHLTERHVLLTDLCTKLRHAIAQWDASPVMELEATRRRTEREAFRALRSDLLTQGMPPDLWIARFARYVHEHERRMRDWDAQFDTLLADLPTTVRCAKEAATEVIAAIEREFSSLRGVSNSIKGEGTKGDRMKAPRPSPAATSPSGQATR